MEILYSFCRQALQRYDVKISPSVDILYFYSGYRLFVKSVVEYIFPSTLTILHLSDKK